jgi:hypothetical protein
MLDREEIMKVIHGDTLQTAKKTRSVFSRTTPGGDGAGSNGTTKENAAEARKTGTSHAGGAQAADKPPAKAAGA